MQCVLGFSAMTAICRDKNSRKYRLKGAKRKKQKQRKQAAHKKKERKNERTNKAAVDNVDTEQKKSQKKW